MPNHIINKVRFEGSDTDLKALKQLLKGEDNPFDFNKVLPMPAELEDTKSPVDDPSDPKNVALREKYGADNWYDWHITNWGTKWNSYNHTWEDEGIDQDGKLATLDYEFQTAWSMAKWIAFEISKQFPTVKITWQFADEDLGYNCGTIVFKKGKIESDKIYDGGRKGWEFAHNLWAYEDDDEYEGPEDEEDEEDEDEDEDEDHDNYPSIDKINIKKMKTSLGEEYQISYDSSDWCFTGTKEEVLAELGEHLDNMLAD